MSDPTAAGAPDPAALVAPVAPTAPVSPPATSDLTDDWWKQDLPQEIRDDPTVKTFTTIEGMAKSLINAQNLVSKRVEEMTPEQLGQIHARHGRPDEADGYVLAKPESLPEGLEYHDALAAKAKGWFHEAGLSQAQAEKLHGFWNEFAAESFNGANVAREAAQTEAMNKFKAELGSQFEPKVNLAKAAIREFGGQDLKDFLNDTKLGDDPRMVRAFIKIGEAVGEDTLVNGDGGGGGMTPAEAEAKIAAIHANPAYTDATKPEHAGLVAEMARLFAIKHPPGSETTL